MARKSLERAWMLLLLAVWIATPCTAEFYKRVDADGTIVFSDRAEPVNELWRPTPSALQRVGREPETDVEHHLIALRGVETVATSQLPIPSLEHGAEVPFQRSGNLMLVNVRLNDAVVAPFYVDSGCTGISITLQVAARLGLDRKPVRRVTKTRTANGTLLLAKFQLDSVALGSMRVADIAATVNPNLTVGLLGASFLDQFVYTVDPASGVLILEPRD